MLAAGMAKIGDCALNIVTSVVSRANEARGILDAGSKTFTSDTGDLDGFGLILEHPEVTIYKLAEEHGFLDLSNCKTPLNVGDILRVIPNHVCVAVNMFDNLIAIRGETIVGVLPVTARGLLI